MMIRLTLGSSRISRKTLVLRMFAAGVPLGMHRKRRPLTAEVQSRQRRR
jgi:hypothetical protein